MPVSEVTTGLAGAAGSVIDDALASLEEHGRQLTDGLWLEDVTVAVAPHIREWNVDGCWRWDDWMAGPGVDVMPGGTPSADVGIDLVARRRDDGGWIAIQVKSRTLDEHGEGNPIPARFPPNRTPSQSAAPLSETKRAHCGNVRPPGGTPGGTPLHGTVSTISFARP